MRCVGDDISMERASSSSTYDDHLAQARLDDQNQLCVPHTAAPQMICVQFTRLEVRLIGATVFDSNVGTFSGKNASTMVHAFDARG